ncbi:aldehyde dehydrogenase family protein [Alkalicoccus daliensis]|uniref:3-sulfolactaldehyde dehydrogenase n=1 Tax=Alkalicoccus daliensis TaxID=745820 RepID=A0A1H0GVW0_9BACI|nr:aldehyde dehydrogenase family protein [Alkalicoccus daliensis]SDO10999.1 glyceraldehyde-3-phosphate dehydrogenase (NADP+) [Alkalicoccus daliensis]
MQTKVLSVKMYVLGEWVSQEETFEVVDPQNNEVIARVPKTTREYARKVIDGAAETFYSISSWPTHERMKVLQRAADYIEKNHERYAYTIAREGSKTITEARGEVSRAVQTLRISGEEARRIKGETINFDQKEGSENRTGYYFRFPIGVVAAITPFNDPLNLVAHKVGPALAAGNPVVVKPASVTPLSALLLAEALDQAGVPRGFLSVITGAGRELGEELVTHPEVKMISFTGGVNAGDKIIDKAGRKKIGMELGSNSPVIVLNDADLHDAVKSTVSGAFSAAGQNCIGVQRVFIEQNLFDDFAALFAERTKELQMGDKLSEWTDMGPLINETEAKRVEEWVNEAVSEGARILQGGKREGAFYEPTVLVDVPVSCRLYYEEIFGPVVLLEEVESLQEAVSRANDVDYGLQAGIFTKNIDHAFYAVNHLHVGGVMVNDSSDYRIDEMPFGGVKQSGLGREGVAHSIQEMTEPRVVCIKLTQPWSV